MTGGILFPALLLTLAATAGAQTFDVAVIKPSAPGARGGMIRQMPGGQRYSGANIPLKLIMTVAYSVTDRQISGGPDWVATEPFDIEAKSESRHTSEELHDMLARLIEARFQLKIRRETKQLPVYELVIDKSGSKLGEHEPRDLDYPPMGPAPDGLKGTNVTMQYFALVLSRNLDRTVVDKTGLPARYDLTLHYSREGAGGPVRLNGAETPDSDAPTSFTALREQLGLRLVPAKGPVEFLVIEHAEKPADN